MRLLQALTRPDASEGDFHLSGYALLENASWLDTNWMFCGLFCGVIAFFWLMSWPGSLKEKLHNPLWLAYLALPVYSVHQFEEHGYDIFGRRYMFGPIFNAGTGTKQGIELHYRVITWVNITGIWLIFPLWARMATKKNGFYPATLAWGVAVVNGSGGHLLPYFLESGDLRYVPGAVQSLFMVPLGLYILLVVFKKEGVLMGTIVPIIIGFIWHIVAIHIPNAFARSIDINLRFPFWLSLSCLLPLLVVNSSWFQRRLSHGKARLA